VKQALFNYVNHARIAGSWNQPLLRNEGKKCPRINGSLWL